MGLCRLALLTQVVRSFGLFFFFQAEDGIRDHCVTGVQTCALPIYVDAVDGAAEDHRAQAVEQVGDAQRGHQERDGLLVDQRSEEHTSELQSHSDLVCRLLLEKKKKKQKMKL